MACFVPVLNLKHFLELKQPKTNQELHCALTSFVSGKKLQSDRIEDHIFKAGSCTKPAATEPGGIKPMKRLQLRYNYTFGMSQA